MNKRIKRIVQGLFMMTAWMIPAVVLMAGDINAEEQRIIDVSEGEFTYEGKIYIATDAAKDRLYLYLTQDDIDLNKEDTDRAIEKGFGSVYDGIESGYLVLAPGQTADGDSTKKPGENTGSKPGISAEDLNNMKFDELLEYVDEYKEEQSESRKEKGSISESLDAQKLTSEGVNVVGEVANAGKLEAKREEIVPVRPNDDIVTPSVKKETFNDNANFPIIAIIIAGIVIAAGIVAVIIHRNRPGYGRNKNNW